MTKYQKKNEKFATSFFKMPIKINCLIPNISLKEINVELYHKIQLIMNIVGKNVSLIHQGQVLNPSLTVGFYKINDGDCLISVNSQNTKQINSWKNISLNRADIMSKLSGKNVVNKEKELVRLKDVSMLKMDLKPRSYRKIVSRLINKPEKVMKIEETKYTAPIVPCCDALPVFWKQAKPQPNKLSEEKNGNVELNDEKPINKVLA